MIKDWFSQWIFNSYSPSAKGLALYRILVSVTFLLFLLPDAAYYSYLSGLPNDFYSPPPGPMMLLNEFPSVYFFQVIHALLVLSWIGVLLGYKTKYMSLLAALFMLILMGFIFSIGKMNHQMLLVLTPAIMAFSNWGGTYSIDSTLRNEQKEAEGWPITLLALFIGFMFFTAGLPKILGGWLDPDSLATKGHILNQHFARGRTELLSGWAVEIQNPLLWGFLDWATVVFETGFLIAVFRAGWTRFFVCLAVLFHFSILLTMNIAFLFNFTAYAAFLPWDKIHDKIKQQIRKSQLLRSTISLPLFFGFTLFLLFAIIKYIDQTGWILPLTEPSFDEIFLTSTGVCIVIWFAMRRGLRLVNSM